MERGEIMNNPISFVLKDAIGSIEADESQLEHLNELTERLHDGEFFAETRFKIVCDCVDGRPDTDFVELRPNSAGGSESLMVADDLWGKKFAKGTDGSTLAQYANVLRFLDKNGLECGGHTAHGSEAPGSGCGANDKLEDIYRYITDKGDVLRDLAGQLGVVISEEMHAQITGNASTRTTFSTGRELLDELQEHDSSHVAQLDGKHREVVTIVNTKYGTTLDRAALAAEFPDLQAFNVDVWALEETARAITSSDEEFAGVFTALVYYNLATASVLGGSNMPVVVVK